MVASKALVFLQILPSITQKVALIYNANQQPRPGLMATTTTLLATELSENFSSKKDKFGVEDSKQLQLSAEISYATIVKEVLVPIIEDNIKSLPDFQKEALKQLSAWDGVADENKYRCNRLLRDFILRWTSSLKR